jgi:hypothetical protein
MILFMAIGSPALITYSLTLTILNRIWVRRIFGSLHKRLDDVPKDLRHELRKRLRAAQYILQESQQVPMRASQVHGWLSSLIALEENHPWWMRGKKDLKNTRRGYTLSLLAQIGMAFLAYTLTIAISLNSAPLGNSEGDGVLLTAGGGIWIWMIPVILGWIMCGTQARTCSIPDALNDKTHCVFRIDMEGNILQRDNQHGICSRSGLIPRPRSLELPSTSQPTAETPENTRNSSVGGLNVTNLTEEDAGEEVGTDIVDGNKSTRFGMAADNIALIEIKELKSDGRPIGEFPFDYEKLRLPTWLGFTIEGDEALEGPLFNYARPFTFREFSSTVTNAFVAYLESLKAESSQKKDIAEVAASCHLDSALLQAYTPWHKIDSWHHMLIAAGAAIFVQWGTVSTIFFSSA